MGRLKYVLLIILLFNSLTQSAYSQGCLVGSTLYPNYGGNVLGRWWQTINPRPATAPSCPRVQTIGSAIRNCRAGFFGENGYGQEYNYITLNPPTDCPLDDYIWLLILTLSGIGFYYTRRRTHLQESLAE